MNKDFRFFWNLILRGLNFLKTTFKTKRLWPIGWAFIFSCGLNFKLLLWLFERWIALPYGPIGLGLLVLGGIKIGVKRKAFSPHKNLSLKWLIGGLLLSVLASLEGFFPHIIQAFLLFMAFGAFIFSVFKFPPKTALTFLGWLSFSLPLIPVLGSSIGLINREIYTSILSLLSPNTQKIGTSLYTGGYAYHIDASCSGAQGIYLLMGIWFWRHLLAQPKHIHFKRLLQMLVLYGGLNGLRVGILYLLHNGFHLSGLNSLDQILGLAAFTFPLVFITLRPAGLLKFSR